jgi:hypothetical protein
MTRGDVEPEIQTDDQVYCYTVAPTNYQKERAKCQVLSHRIDARASPSLVALGPVCAQQVTDSSPLRLSFVLTQPAPRRQSAAVAEAMALSPKIGEFRLGQFRQLTEVDPCRK